MKDNDIKKRDGFNLLIAGDIFPVKTNKDYFISGDINTLFGEKVIKMFRDADYSVCNTEGCLTDNPDTVIKIGPVVTAETDTLNAIKALGVDAVTIGNTHIMDGGKNGYREYIEALEKYGIDHFGSGTDLSHMKNYILIDKNSVKVILYNVTEYFFNGVTVNSPGANIYDETPVLEELRKLKEKCDYLVVLYHGGLESTFYNSPVIRTRFHRMADAGADILISQHTHAIGEEEKYKDSLLIYGQGNFCFNLAKTVNEYLEYGMLLSFDFSKTGYNLQRHVVRRTETGCVYDDKQDLSGLMERTRLHDLLLKGDKEAEEIFLKENSDVSRHFIERLLKGFYGTDELPPYSRKQLMLILVMLQTDEMHEMAVRYFTDLLQDCD
jgi:Putative enzyme of poly-gamma-glutamate biosynthesis (capsule formation)